MVDISIRTLVFVFDQDQVLLGYKKTGFGAGKWNGFGGKVEPGETIRTAAERELKEEAGVQAGALEERGVVSFSFEIDLPVIEVHVFWAQGWAGEIRETGEMRPQWFALTDLPYGAMWVNDMHWLPWLLAGKYFTGTFHLQDTETLLHWELKEVAREALSRHI